MDKIEEIRQIYKDGHLNKLTEVTHERVLEAITKELTITDIADIMYSLHVCLLEIKKVLNE